jgi:hypothetical protein
VWRGVAGSCVFRLPGPPPLPGIGGNEKATRTTNENDASAMFALWLYIRCVQLQDGTTPDEERDAEEFIHKTNHETAKQ